MKTTTAKKTFNMSKENKYVLLILSSATLLAVILNLIGVIK